ncbi:NUDIX hydrolase [Thalassotalea sp. Y01]|uniref:NUDIX hydrolase n=1 Tax=Thalassotalea sp. Y01 TaxID=2729613 RepID=UPI00145E164A|nr:NUDIX hydrolase [Thalassotalea sp. Y01]NMP15401.1 NUDIX hydrolase [Thalassotalea sp. Y01]
MSQFKPNTTVAGIIHCQGKFLMVEEIDSDQLVYNQPAGHIEANETIYDAFVREVKEETGLSVTPSGLSGIYYNHRADLDIYYVRFCFIVELDQYLSATPEDDDIIACHWLSYQQIIDKQAQLRSVMVKKCLDDYVNGARFSLDILQEDIS